MFQVWFSFEFNKMKNLFLSLRSDNKVTVHFVNRDGEKITVKGSPGDSLLDVVINEDLDIDGFGTLALPSQWDSWQLVASVCPSQTSAVG